MTKAYTRIVWENYPSDSTPLNENNLNRMDLGLDTVDDRVIAMDTTKLNVADNAQVIKGITFDSATGVFTFTRFNDSTFTIDTLLEKIIVNFDYDDDPTSAHYQNLIITMEDGTVKYVDLSALITQYEFVDSSTIGFTITSGNVSASVLNGSITEEKLQPNYLALIRVQAENAANSATNAGLSAAAASNSATTASTHADTSKSWAVGGTGTRSGEDTNNAKYWATQATVNDGTLTITQNGTPLGTFTANSASNVSIEVPGGDSVSWTQIQSTGTKIAEIDINGTPTDVYAPNGGGGGGHTVITPDGTMPQRGNMYFTDVHGTDDSVNDETKLTVFKEIQQADFDLLTPTEQTTGGYIITDANPSYIPANNCVSVTADGVKTYGQAISELYALVDTTKVTRNSCIIAGNMNHLICNVNPSDYRFSTSLQHTQNRFYSQTIFLTTGAFYVYDIQNGTPVGYDFTNTVAVNNWTITLYYNIVASPVVETENFSITPETGITIASEKCTKEGNLTKVMFKVEFSSAVGENQEVVIGSIPAEYAPPVAIWAFTGSSYSFGAAFITTAGVIKFRAFHIYSTQYFNDVNLCFVY